MAKEAHKPVVVDDWQIRVPTYTPDVAATLRNMAAAALEARAAAGWAPWAGGGADGPAAAAGPSSSAAAPPLPPSLRGVFHYSSADRYTRYALAVAFGRILGVPTAHITADPKVFRRRFLSRREFTSYLFRPESLPAPLPSPLKPPPGAVRPYDCQLRVERLPALGLAAPFTPFEVAARVVLGLPPLAPGQ